MRDIGSESSGVPAKSTEGDIQLPETGWVPESEKQLAELSRLAMIGELTAHFSHEVANPLTLIAGEVELIDRQLSDDHPMRDNLRVMLGAVERIEAIAQSTLAFSSRAKDSNSSCELVRVIEDARRFIEPYLESRNVWFQFTPPVESVPLPGSDRQLVQVLVNLFQNAIDAMAGSPERTLKVRVFPDTLEGHVQIEIEDTGKRIMDENVGRVFDQFFTTKGAGGTGLGLHIAREIVEHELDGKITIRNGDQTTTFTVSLPQ